MNNIQFEKRKSIEQVEESNELAPKFDSNGLIPVVTTDFSSGELLMQGYMNEEAFKKTISLGEAVYFSRSRNTLWHKGKTSGLTQKIKEIRIDDDQDCVWLRVDVKGGASCHVGYRSVFIEVFHWIILALKLFLNLKRKKKFLILKKYIKVPQILLNYNVRQIKVY